MSDSKRLKDAFNADGDVLCRTHIGGQALIEGIMMRGRYNWAVAIREPSGDIYTEEHDLASGRPKNSWLRWPVVRGCTAFVESLGLGYKALNIATEHAYDWEETEEERTERLTKEAKKKKTTVEELRAAEDAQEAAKAAEHEAKRADHIAAATAAGQDAQEAAAKFDEEAKKAAQEEDSLGPLMTISMVIGLIVGVAIFVVVPAALSNLVFGADAMNSVGWNIFDGILRVVIFIAYIWLISRMKDIKRMFCYHGAEHKTIHCFEHGLPLTVANAQQFPTLHVRCGTAFLIMVMLIAIFVYTVLGTPINSLVDLTGVTEGPLRFVLIVLTRIVLMPIIAGLSYEITVQWAGKRPNNPLVRVILWPGMQMQRLTTNPPEDSMVECAIAAMQLVVAREELEAAREAGKDADGTAATGAVAEGATDKTAADDLAADSAADKAADNNAACQVADDDATVADAAASQEA